MRLIDESNSIENGQIGIARGFTQTLTLQVTHVPAAGLFNCMHNRTVVRIIQKAHGVVSVKCKNSEQYFYRTEL